MNDWTVEEALRFIWLCAAAFVVFVAGLLAGWQITNDPAHCETPEATP